MTKKRLTEQEIRERLSGKIQDERVDELIDQYAAASDKIHDMTPDMGLIDDLTQKSKEDKLLSVRFKLTSEQYDALVEYFEMPQQPATLLVQKVLSEFIKLI